MIVSVEVPIVVALFVEIVSVLEPLPLMVAGEKLAVAPEGNPEALSVMTPLNEFRLAVFTV